MRYSRQEVLDRIGVDGQEKLRNATVTIVGVGALGSTAAELLARAGVGKIIILDRDLVELTNLQRQSLYGESDVGEPKALVAQKHLKAINSSIEVSGHCVELSYKNTDLLQGLILDCTDNLTTRFVIDEFCVKNKQQWIHAAVIGDKGRVWVYHQGGPTYRCFTGNAQQQDTCETAGVLNSAVTLIASLQVNEAFKVLTKQGAEQKLLAVNIWNNTIDKIAVKQNPKTPTLNGVFEYLEGKDFKEAQRLCASGRFEYHIELDLEKVRSMWESFDYDDRGSALHMEKMWVFEDGRVLIKADSEEKARSLIAQYLGN